MRLLLMSNSTAYGGGYLDHCAEAIVRFLGPSVRRVAFVPYAVFDRDAYAAMARARFGKMGLALDSVHDTPFDARVREDYRLAQGKAVQAIEDADALFVGGGNTFRLIDSLWRQELIEPIRRRVLAGMPYLGASAGSNVAGPTIKTTNDMPIIQPATLEALGLVPFQINPHYLDPNPGSTHMGETREERIREFHEENDTPVVGLREGTWLLIDGPAVSLQGSTGARLFRQGQAPLELAAGPPLDFLLQRAR
jgi:dipeptidase E